MGVLKYRHSRDLTDQEKDDIIEQVCLGKVYTRICDDMGITRRSLREAMFKDPLFKEKMELARVDATDDLADSLLTVTDGCETLVQVGCAKIKSENIKAVVGFRNPNKYGNRVDININQRLDLSSVLAAADARIVHVRDHNRQLAEAQKTLEASVVDNTALASEDSDFDDLL